VTAPVPVTYAPPSVAAAGAQPQPAPAPVAQAAQIPLGKEIRDFAVTSDGARVVVQTDEGTRIVDTASRAVSPPIPVGGAFALTSDGSRAYVNAVNAMHIIDIGSGQIVGELPVLEGVREFVLSPDGGTGYLSFRYRPEVAVVEMATGRVMATVPVPVSGAQLGLSPDGATLYLFSGSVGIQTSDTTVAIDARTMSVAATIRGRASWVGFRTDGSEVYLGNSVQLTVIDGRTRQPVRSAKLPDTGNVVTAGATSPDGSYLALADYAVNRIHLVDSTTQVEHATVNTDAPTNELGFSPDGRSLYVSTRAGSLIVVDTSAVVR
jgi:sugar lactone lactonase YvrE